MYKCRKCEVRFYSRGILINAQAIKMSLLEKGLLDALAEEYASMPMFKGETLNVRVRPIKEDNSHLGFTNDQIFVEV